MSTPLPRRARPCPPPRHHRSRCPVGVAVLALALSPLLWPAPLLAQTETADALVAADPDHPASALPQAWPPLAPLDAPAPPTDDAQARRQWQQAHERVAEFPRGHADLLRWETTPPDTADAPAPLPPDPLGADEALQRSLTLRPQLFTRPGQGTLERAAVHQAWLAHAHALRRAWIEAVAASEQRRHQQALQHAADSGAELARRMVQTGNWSLARLLPEQLTQADARAALLRAGLAERSAHEQLARLLGWWQADELATLARRLPLQLPALPDSLPPSGDAEATALRNDPTLAAERETARRQLAGIAPARRAAWQQAARQATQQALAPLPAGTWPAEAPALNDSRLARDHALDSALAAEAALLQRAVERRSATRTTWARLQTQHELARQARDLDLPLRSAQAEQAQLRYNGMLQSTWELLAAQRDRLQAAAAAGQALRDFWLAQADWQALQAGGMP